MRLRTVFSLIILAVFGAGLAACGGGSVSSGGGSGGTGGASSSLVVEVARDDRVAAFQQRQEQGGQLAAVISDLLISKALAQTEGVAIFVDGVEEAQTDADGSAVIPLEPGTYEVCILDPTVLDNCTTVVVEPDSVVVISNVNIDESGVVSFDPPTTEPDEEVTDFTDPEKPHKTIICHKGNKTLSVGTPAAEKGHMAHGDTMGPCPDDVAEGDEDEEEDEDDEEEEDEDEDEA